MSNSTFSPSTSDLKPLPWIAEWCTKQSFWPLDGVMKPKPFASLNHFTVPVVRAIAHSLDWFPSESGDAVPADSECFPRRSSSNGPTTSKQKRPSCEPGPWDVHWIRDATPTSGLLCATRMYGVYPILSIRSVRESAPGSQE